MAKGYGKNLAGVFDGTVVPARKADGRVYGARRRTYREIFDLSSAAVARNIGDTNVVCKRPAACAFDSVSITVSATLGSTTLSVGNATDPVKYMAATTFTAVDTPASFGKAAARAADPLTDAEEVIVTIAAAALPNAGFLIVDFHTLAR